jgi:hypothetical protein
MGTSMARTKTPFQGQPRRVKKAVPGKTMAGKKPVKPGVGFLARRLLLNSTKAACVSRLRNREKAGKTPPPPPSEKQ